MVGISKKQKQQEVIIIREYMDKNPYDFRRKNGDRVGFRKAKQVLDEAEVNVNLCSIKEALREPYGIKIIDEKTKMVEQTFYKLNKTCKWYSKEQLKALGLGRLLDIV